VSGARIQTPVRSVDVLPTALELLGIATSVPNDGTSLVPLLIDEAQSMDLACYSEAVYPRYHYGWSDLVALRVGNLKYIAAPRPELYDLEADPNETRNLYGERNDLAAHLEARMSELESGWQDVRSPERVEEIDPDTRARLAALGYLGNFVSDGGETTDRSSLADPKDKIHLYNLMRRAREASLNDNDSNAAIQALEKVLEEDPSVIDAWVSLGNEQRRVRRIDDSIASFKQALSLRADSELAVINLARAYREAGREQEAILGFEQFLKLDPRNEQIHYELAQMLIDLGELDTADSHLQESVRLAPKMAAAQNARGVVAIHRQDLRVAEALINEALAIKPDVRLAHFNLALIAEQRRDAVQAERWYRRELELYPESYKVAFNLGRLLGAMGDRAGQRTWFESAIEINPGFAEGHFFLAKVLVDANQDLKRAEQLARTGLSLGPSPGMAPMGYYLLADIYTRQGRNDEARQEVATARALENRN
jgi:tetratricopeptide (TPR) repeat protein